MKLPKALSPCVVNEFFGLVFCLCALFCFVSRGRGWLTSCFPCWWQSPLCSSTSQCAFYAVATCSPASDPFVSCRLCTSESPTPGTNISISALFWAHIFLLIPPVCFVSPWSPVLPSLIEASPCFTGILSWFFRLDSLFLSSSRTLSPGLVGHFSLTFWSSAPVVLFDPL